MFIIRLLSNQVPRFLIASLLVPVLTSVSKFNFWNQLLCQVLSLLLYQSNVYSKSVIIFIVERQHNSFIVAQDDINLGPLHMTPLTGLAQFPRSCLTFKFFVKFSMCSYERAGWLGFRDLSFFNQDLGKWAGNFAMWTLQPSHWDESRSSGSPDGRPALSAVFSTS